MVRPLPSGKKTNYVIPGGHYENVPQLLDTINAVIHPDFKPTASPVRFGPYREIFNYVPHNGKVLLVLSNDMKLEMNSNLRDMLGFRYLVYTGGLQVHASKVANIHRGLSTLYVYLSVLEDRIVGDTRAPLLRMVPMKGERGQVVFQTFHDVHYVPLKFNSFDHITVNIRNGAGDLVPFDSGEVILTVQLRRRGFS